MIYLDHAAATPLLPEALKKMEPFLSGKEQFGNPSSIHKAGREARAAIEESRANIAGFLGCEPKEVIFTSGGTESNNWAIFGLAEAFKKKGNHIISTAMEHDSILGPLKQLESRGFKVTYLQPDFGGLISVKALQKAITYKTIFASIIYANNEIGTIQDIPGLAAVLKKRGIAFHTDACQAVNYLPVDPRKLGVDCMTINSGKIHGPKGAGALVVKEGLNIVPLLFGGGQELRMRAGTENVTGIVGFGEAIKHIPKDSSRITKLRDAFIKKLLNLPGVTLNGHPTRRLPNNVNVRIQGVDHESLLVRLDMEDIAASAGSACSSGAIEPSHVLLAIGLSKKEAQESIRFSLGRSTTVKEINKTIDKLSRIVKDVRA